MRKRLITVKNLFEYVQENELVIQADMIITPGAKDIIRDKGIGVRYEKTCGVSNYASGNEIRKNTRDCDDLEKKVIEILVKNYKITDSDTIRKILSKIKEL